jgi:orotate phosphoribosyltransferase
VQCIFAERALREGRARYAVPAALRAGVQGKRIALVDDAISAGSAVSGTLADLEACGGRVIVLGALILVGTRPQQLATSLNLPLEWLVEVPTELWEPSDCPLCRRGEPPREP